jgi:hypothetical protein
MGRHSATAPATAPEPAVIDDVQALTPYWIGLTDDAPMDRIVLAGVEFVRWTEDVQAHPVQKGRTARIPRRGRVLNLEPDALDRIKAHGREKVIRTAGKRALIMDRRSPTYRAERGDTPCIKFVFAIPAPPNVTTAGSPSPSSLAE